MSDKLTDPHMFDRLINIKEVSYMMGLKRATIYKWINEGKFPRPLKVGEKASRWKRNEILEFISRLAQS